MHLRITNKSARTLDVFRFSFESAGALELVTNTQGLPHYRLAISASRVQACMPLWLIVHGGEES